MAQPSSLRTFEVRVQVDEAGLAWPEEYECETDYGLGCNREYHDMRGVAWSEVASMIQAEGALLRRVREAGDVAGEAAAIEQEIEDSLEEGADWSPLDGFDLGVASAVYAVSALGCVPFTSCNGGAFGDRRHHEAHPLVALFAKPAHLAALAACAKEVKCGLEQSGGTLILYSRSSHGLFAFAEELQRMCSPAKGV